MLLFDLLAEAAARFPHKTAVVFPGERISYGDLAERARRFAGYLSRRGIGRGQRVALLHDNAIDALVAFWGTLALGAQAVDIPAHAGAQTIQEVLGEARPAAVVIDGRQLDKLSMLGPPVLPLVIGRESLTAAAKAQGLELHGFETITREALPAPEVEASPDDVAMIVYTSGTTGHPKGVMLSHTNLLSNVSAANSLTGLSSEDSVLVIVPLYFIHGRMQLLTYAMVGGTVYFSAGLQFPKQVLKELQEHAVTWFSGVPYHFTTLLERTHLSQTEFPALKNILITGGALSPSSLRRLASALPGVGLHLAYGATEASPRITYLGPAEALKRPDCAGRPLPGVTVEILATDGVAVPQGAVGEVTASGPNIMRGYVSGDHLTTGRIDERGRLHTGDLGRLDADGYLYLFGRKSDMIKSAGERIFPGEIEDVLNKHPAVAESAVLGVKDELLGERIVALVVLERGARATFAELRTHCLRWLPFVRTPKEIHFVSELPKTASQKLNRGALPLALETSRKITLGDLPSL